MIMEERLKILLDHYKITNYTTGVEIFPEIMDKYGFGKDNALNRFNLQEYLSGNVTHLIETNSGVRSKIKVLKDTIEMTDMEMLIYLFKKANIVDVNMEVAPRGIYTFTWEEEKLVITNDKGVTEFFTHEDLIGLFVPQVRVLLFTEEVVPHLNDFEFISKRFDGFVNRLFI